MLFNYLESTTESRVGSHHERQQPDNQSVSSVRTLVSPICIVQKLNNVYFIPVSSFSVL